MKALVEYAHPDHLTQASNETQALWEAGQAALGIMWGSRGATILDDEGSTEQVTSNTVLSAAPSVKPGESQVLLFGGMASPFRRTFQMTKPKQPLPHLPAL